MRAIDRTYDEAQLEHFQRKLNNARVKLERCGDGDRDPISGNTRAGLIGYIRALGDTPERAEAARAVLRAYVPVCSVDGPNKAPFNGWHRVAAPDGSTICYTPDRITAEKIAAFVSVDLDAARDLAGYVLDKFGSEWVKPHARMTLRRLAGATLAGLDALAVIGAETPERGAESEG